MVHCETLREFERVTLSRSIRIAEHQRGVNVDKDITSRVKEVFERFSGGSSTESFGDLFHPRHHKEDIDSLIMPSGMALGGVVSGSV